MAKVTIAEAVHVSITIDGTITDLDLAAGTVDVEPAVADLLITQGLAAPATKGSKTTEVAAPAAKEITPTAPETPEA